MEFERIGKNTVQCRMTVEEMNEYGLRIEDFFTNQKKSRDFLEQLVERAEEEIGYEVESGMISMQLMRMPDDSLVITFSDKGEDGLHNMLNQIQNLAGIIGEDSENDMEDEVFGEAGASMESDMNKEENMSEFAKKLKDSKTDNEEYLQHMKEVEKKRMEKLRQKQTASKVFQFDSLDMLENFASIIKLEKNVPSKLYKDMETGMWYLLVKKGKLKLEEYQNLCQHLQEYAVLCSQQPFVEQYCKEHYHCIIGKHALRTIREYIS